LVDENRRVAMPSIWGKQELKRMQGMRRGSTMVEFALFFILFMMLSLGLMEFGLAVWTYSTMSHAARAGARYALVHGASNPITDGDPTVAQIVTRNAIGLDPATIIISTTYDTGDPLVPATNEKGHVVQVRVQYPFQLLTGALVLPNRTLTMQSTARMVVAN
jgi:Flp pilus assembly protein TadG